MSRVEGEMSKSDEAVVPSCNECAFLIDHRSPSSLALLALGVPSAPVALCAKLGAVLAVSPAVDAERAEKVAGKCASFARPSATENARRALGEREAFGGWKVATAAVDEDGHVGTGTAPPAATCVGCRNYVRGQVILDEAEGAEEAFTAEGIPFPIQPYYCAATGSLHAYSGPEVSGAAARCGEFAKRSDDDPSPEVLFSSAALFAHVREDLGMTGAAETGEPENGPADRELTAAEIDAGINGFHRVFSDDGKRYVDLPVFDPAHFDEVERAKIPAAGDDAGPELFHDYANLAYRVAAAWALGETPALTGAPGLGKSQAAYFLAWKMGLPLERVSITSASQLDDLAGYTELVRHAEGGNATEFVHGRIPQAWSKPCVLLLDEPNAGPPEVWQFLRPLTDAAKQLVLDVNHGERVERDPHSYLMMAMNPAWDYRNTGVTALSDADGRRLVHVTVSPPSAEVEREIIVAHLEADGVSLPSTHLDVLTEIGQDLRALATSDLGSAGALQITWGIAQQVKVAKLLAYFDFPEAFRLAGADNLEPEQRDLILGSVNRISSVLTSPRNQSARRGRKGQKNTANLGGEYDTGGRIPPGTTPYNAGTSGARR